MVITEISMIHHVGIVLFLLWLLNSYNYCHSIVYFISLIYLFQVHERFSMRLRRKLQHEERKSANQRRVLTDSETVRWLNYAVDKMWPICVEPMVSRRIFLPIIPWFLEKYKPWTVRKAVVQSLYLGRDPPLFTDIRVLRESTEDDHLVLELGLNFLTADDMSAILSAKVRKRLGGMVAKMHLTGMHVEGKILIGVKFLRSWPFIGRLRVCFAEPPYFQMTVKPLFNHGLDVTELPGIAGWLDKLLAIAFEETLVEPNMLVVDMEKFVSPQPDNWFSVDVKEPLAYANVEVMEAVEIRPADLNGLADPYVKGHLGQYRFRTQIQRKTLTPKWREEFKIPIISWEAQNVLEIEVRDKDHFVDDFLGNCFVNINKLRGGKRHDLWLALESVKMGRLHLAVTVVDPNEKAKEHRGEEVKIDDGNPESNQSEMTEKEHITDASKDKPQKIADKFEPIDVEGQKETGIWVHQPGSEVPQEWEPRKGKSRHIDTQILSMETPKSSSRSSFQDDSSSEDDSKQGHRARLGKAFQRGFQKIFHKNPKREDHMKNFDHAIRSPHAIQSPHANVKAVNVKRVNLVMDDGLSPLVDKPMKSGGSSSNEGSGAENTGKHGMRGKAKNMLKNAGESARQLKQVLSKKGSSKFMGTSQQEVPLESDSSSDDSQNSSLCGPVERIPIASTVVPNSKAEPETEEHVQDETKEHVQDVSVGTERKIEEDITTEAHSAGPIEKDIDISKGSEEAPELSIEQDTEGVVHEEKKVAEEAS